MNTLLLSVNKHLLFVDIHFLPYAAKLMSASYTLEASMAAQHLVLNDCPFWQLFVDILSFRVAHVSRTRCNRLGSARELKPSQLHAWVGVRLAGEFPR
jgi:hypothetical protein